MIIQFNFNFAVRREVHSTSPHCLHKAGW